MKRIMNVAGIATVSLVSLGALFKSFHLPGAGVMLVSGGFLFSFLFLPLLIILKFRDEKSTTDKLVFGFGIILAIIITMGVIFKLMHWPMANKLQIGTTLAFTFVYVPLYFFTRIRRPEMRFNTIVSSVLMMAFGALLYSLFDLSYSYQFKKEMQMSHEFLNANAEQLFESNTSMMAMFPEDSEISDLHAMNLDLITQIEGVESTMDGHMAPWHLEEEFEEIRMALEEYNTSLTERGHSAVNIDGVEDLHRLRYYLAKQVIARVKLNLAMSENVALSTRKISS
jgi:hypothetical protein